MANCGMHYIKQQKGALSEVFGEVEEDIKKYASSDDDGMFSRILKRRRRNKSGDKLSSLYEEAANCSCLGLPYSSRVAALMESGKMEMKLKRPKRALRAFKLALEKYEVSQSTSNPESRGYNPDRLPANLDSRKLKKINPVRIKGRIRHLERVLDGGKSPAQVAAASLGGVFFVLAILSASNITGNVVAVSAKSSGIFGAVFFVLGVLGMLFYFRKKD